MFGLIDSADKPNIRNLNMFFCFHLDISSAIEWNYHNLVFPFFRSSVAFGFLTRKAKVNTLENVP